MIPASGRNNRGTSRLSIPGFPIPPRSRFPWACLRDCERALWGLRNRDQVHVIRHEAVTQHREERKIAAATAQQLEGK